MSTSSNQSSEKKELHPRNKHRDRYDFDSLIEKHPELKQFVAENKYGDLSIDFFNPKAVKALNQALLYTYYQLDFWDIPDGYLCPPIPGRADYIHHVAHLVQKQSTPIKCLDIGVGANCIYPIIGVNEYDWNFVGTDIDSISLDAAQKIIDVHPFLSEKVELRQQHNSNQIFSGIIQPMEAFDLSICNPPFHSSAEEANAGSQRKLRNLKGKKSKVVLNFGGTSNELWCEGGEAQFIQNMIHESKQFSSQCKWFTTLVSKQVHLQNACNTLRKLGVVHQEIIPMQHGNKISRILAWSFQK